MAYVASHLIEEVTAHAQSDSLEDAREICADGTYFPNNLRTCTISRHTHHNISQRPFGNITLVDYIPLKYYKFRLPM